MPFLYVVLSFYLGNEIPASVTREMPLFKDFVGLLKLACCKVTSN